ncbi:MAG: hypothetical protein HWE20_00480 [Gammaproteobacteria bacterium]|nr:hypothetical protein [Gammaproteobacteria bacterium]
MCKLLWVILGRVFAQRQIKQKDIKRNANPENKTADTKGLKIARINNFNEPNDAKWPDQNIANHVEIKPIVHGVRLELVVCAKESTNCNCANNDLKKPKTIADHACVAITQTGDGGGENASDYVGAIDPRHGGKQVNTGNQNIDQKRQQGNSF